MTAEEFWSEVRPSGLTAEQELVAFWTRMRDCPCGGHKHATPIHPLPRRKRKRHDVDDDVLLFLL